MENKYSPHPPTIGSLEKRQEVDLSIVLAQIGKKGALELDHDILHLLAGELVAVFEPMAQSAGMGVPLCYNIFSPTLQRPLEIVSGRFVGEGLWMTMLLPLLFEGFEQLVAIVVGGDD
jgi:hypothetical protein